MDLNNAVQDAIFMADIDGEVTPEVEVKEEDAGKEQPAEVVEEEQKEEPKEDDRVSELEAKLNDAQKEINRLGYALRKKDDNKPEKKETPLTRQQLFNIFKEHQDEPEVVFQVLDELSKQSRVDAQEAAEKSLDIKTKKAEADALITSMYPDAFKDGTELNSSINKVVEWAHLDGHPMAHEAALGLLLLKNFPDTIREIKELAKKEVEGTLTEDLKKKNESARKKSIDAAKPSKSGDSKSDETVSLSPQQLETAKALGLKTKEQFERYAKLIKSKR